MPHRDLEIARRRLGLSYRDLWIDYFGLGGRLDVEGLTGYMRGERDTSATDHNAIVQALKEQFLERGEKSPLAYRAH